MAVEEIAATHYRRQVALARRAAAEAMRMWGEVDRSAIAASWLALIGAVLTVVSSAQSIAAAGSGVYVGDVVDELGEPDDPAGTLDVTAFGGIASDGRDLETLLYQPAITALTAIGRGATIDQAMGAGALDLDMIVRTQVADAGRVADGVAIAARPVVAGYVRMLTLPSCDRCIILAGRFYRWNDGFLRHPRCDCRHIPASEDRADDLRTNPAAAFESMTAAEQDKVFTAAGAQAIRDGADIGQVVNARRGAHGLTPAGARITTEEARALRGGRERGHLEPVEVFGRQLLITTEGTTTRGVAGVRLGAKETGVKRPGQRVRSARPPRLMPESIYQIAGDDRDEAIRLLRRFGYLTGQARPRRSAPPDPLAGVQLDELLDGELFAMWQRHADNGGAAERIGAELDRRDQARGDLVDQPEDDIAADLDPEAAETLADLDAGLDEADRQRAEDAAQAARELRIDQLVARGWEYRDAYAEVYGLDPAELLRQERQAAVDADRRAGETREQAVRRQYAEWVRLQYLAAEEGTRGHLLTHQAQAKGIDPITLFSGPAHIARAHASEDLKAWWAEKGGRRTYTEFRAEILGRASDIAEAERIRGRGNDRNFGL